MFNEFYWECKSESRFGSMAFWSGIVFRFRPQKAKSRFMFKINKVHLDPDCNFCLSITALLAWLPSSYSDAEILDSDLHSDLRFQDANITGTHKRMFLIWDYRFDYWFLATKVRQILSPVAKNLNSAYHFVHFPWTWTDSYNFQSWGPLLCTLKISLLLLEP